MSAAQRGTKSLALVISGSVGRWVGGWGESRELARAVGREVGEKSAGLEEAVGLRGSEVGKG